MLRNIDMFAGIGGFSLGLHRTGGFETVATVEIDPYASKVLAARFPGVPNLGDVTKAEFPDADFITAGFPCQDISFAGAGAGITGARSGLYGHVVRAIRMVRPRGALLENVAALLGRGLDRVLGDLAEVGYDAEWHCIPAAAVGAPHRRDRIWIIANPGSEQHEGCRAPLSGEIAKELSRAAAASIPAGHGGEINAFDPDANGIRSHRAGMHVNGGAELRDEQERQFGPLGQDVADPQILSEREPANETNPFPDCGEARDEPGDGGEPLAHPHVEGELQSEGLLANERRRPGDSGEKHGGHWRAEPNVGRVAHGVPARVDRLRCLGNAIVPQVAEVIGRAILTQDKSA